MNGCMKGWMDGYLQPSEKMDTMTLWLTLHVHVAFLRSIRASQLELDELCGLASCACDCASPIDSPCADFPANTLNWTRFKRVGTRNLHNALFRLERIGAFSH